MERRDAGNDADGRSSALATRAPDHAIRRSPAPRDALDLLEQFGTTISVQRDREIHGQGDQATSATGS